MTNSSKNIDVRNWYLSGFKDFESKLNGESESYLHLIRKLAFEKLGNTEFPTMKNEEWKYTNVNPVLETNYIPAFISEKTVITADDVNERIYTGFDCYKMVFINGEYSEELSDMENLPEGVTAGSIRKLLKEQPEIVEKYIGKNLYKENAFNLLNSAYATDGIFVHAAKGVVVEKPIQVVYINGSKDQNLLITPRNIFAADENAEFSVITNHSGIEGKSYFTNIVTEGFLQKDAKIKVYKLQNEADNAYHIERAEVDLKETSVFSHYNITFGGSLVRNDINTELNGEYCESNLYGLYFGSSDQHIDNHSLVKHMSPNCESNELYKGILDDSSRGVFNGKIYVRKDAQKTNAYQSNKTILLSDDARIDTKPQLEIYADDVKCSHGATIGHLDDTAYFYIISRGVPAELAKSMLIRAFVDDVVGKINIEPLREQINHQIFEHLHRVEI